jgi:hypothetical protein
MLNTLFSYYEIEDVDDELVYLVNVTVAKDLSKNILNGDFFGSVHFNISSGKLEFIMNNTVEDWLFLKPQVCEQMDS